MVDGPTCNGFRIEPQRPLRLARQQRRITRQLAQWAIDDANRLEGMPKDQGGGVEPGPGEPRKRRPLEKQRQDEGLTAEQRRLRKAWEAAGSFERRRFLKWTEKRVDELEAKAFNTWARTVVCDGKDAGLVEA
jgi:hypothetical protein